MPQLDPSWFASQLFWLFIAFGALYAVLARLVLPPLQAVVNARHASVEGDVGAAQRMKNTAQKAREDYERMLAEARARAQQALTEAMLAQKRRAEEAGKDMDRQVAVRLAEAEQKISARKRDLVTQLSSTAAELSGMIVETLLRGSQNTARYDGKQAKIGG